VKTRRRRRRRRRGRGGEEEDKGEEEQEEEEEGGEEEARQIGRSGKREYCYENDEDELRECFIVESSVKNVKY
jgi:hypothetical protein